MIGVDSNLIIYAMRQSADRRHLRAIDILQTLALRGELFLPLQVMAESFQVFIRKSRMHPRQAADILQRYTLFAATEPYERADFATAMLAVIHHRLSFWDALIWAVCERMVVPVLLTEDMQDGRTLGQVTFVNPFGERSAALLQV